MGYESRENPEAMKSRTKQSAGKIIERCRLDPNNREGRLIGDQIFRSGTSTASNYRAACSARSKAECISKMGIAGEKADETITRNLQSQWVCYEDSCHQ